ncbi:MAG: DUF5718 family protein [Campylobacterota bacterium]|nr:DUF5718 family protein [Campylobacterota bacterium]
MSKDHLKEFIGFGIAGNFAHHLEQAGESIDFLHVEVDEEHAPKGIFPFYLPQCDSFLGTYPLSNKTIVAPNIEENLHLEPEVALICELIYEGTNVVDIVPNYFTAYNDCSIRKEGAKKISEKKNWGENTKGISSQILPIDTFLHDGVMDSYHIASFLKRDGVVHEYGEDSPVLTYNYFYGQLTSWAIKKLNTQKDHGPLEDLNSHLKNAGCPKGMVLSVGATSYTKFGETTFLKPKDEIYVYVYDHLIYSEEDIVKMVEQNNTAQQPNISKLHQVVI